MYNRPATLSPRQSIIIHTLISKMRVDDGSYREMLASYQVKTSRELSFNQAREFIELLVKLAEKHGVRTPAAAKKLRFDSLGNRPGFAYPAQLRKIAALWSGVSRATTPEDKDKALNTFLSRRWNIERIEWLPRNLVGRVIFAIKAMQQTKERHETDGAAVQASA